MRYNWQQKVARRMLEESHQRFEDEMKARKYISITTTSKATAAKDLQDLVQKGILKPNSGGRSSRYKLIFDKNSKL